MTLQQQLEELKKAYAAGVDRASLSDRTTIEYVPQEELWRAIQRLEALVAATAGRRIKAGKIVFRG